MEDIIIQRFRKVIEKYNLSVTALGKLIGIHPSTLNRQFSGESIMSLNTVNAFLQHFKDVSAEWLLRGEGAMIKGESTSNDFPKSFDAKIEIGSDGCLKIKIKE